MHSPRRLQNIFAMANDNDYFIDFWLWYKVLRLLDERSVRASSDPEWSKYVNTRNMVSYVTPFL